MKSLKGLVLIFLATACIRDVDPNTLIKDQKKLVIFSFIDTDEEYIEAQVSLLGDFYNLEREAEYSDNYTAQINYISSASITIDDGIKYAKLIYNPFYHSYRASTTTFPIEEGKTYNLTVKYNSIVAQASCVVPINDGQYFPSIIINDTSAQNPIGANANTIQGKFSSRSNALNRFSTNALGCGSFAHTYQGVQDSVYYDCVPIFQNNQSNDSLRSFTFGQGYNFNKIEISIVLEDEPSSKVNTRYRSYDPLGEPSSTYTNFTNAFGVFGSSSTKKIVLTFN